MKLGWGTAMGLALGLTYAASPLTVWFILVMLGLFAWAGHGLSRQERQYVWGLLALGIAIRVYLIGALFLGSDAGIRVGFFWDGDGVYIKERALILRDIWSGAPVPALDVFHAFDHTYGWSAYLFVLAYLQYLTGPAPYGVHLFNVTMFIAAAVVLHHLVRSAYGRAPALIGMALMLFQPTLIAWSVSALKESLFVFLFAAGLWGAVTVIRAPRVHLRVLGMAVLAMAITAGDGLRPGTSVIMIGGLGAGLAGRFAIRRATVLVALILCLPWIAWGLWQTPSIQARTMTQLKAAAGQHFGNVMTEGHSYRVLDDRLYGDRRRIATMTPAEGARFVVRALATFVVAPLPWQLHSGSSLLILPQQLLWYVLVVSACVGIPVGLRRHALLSCLLIGLAAAASAAVALHNGNIGTMVRFRDWVVPLVVWLSALGGTAAISRIMSRAAQVAEVARCH